MPSGIRGQRFISMSLKTKKYALAGRATRFLSGQEPSLLFTIPLLNLSKNDNFHAALFQIKNNLVPKDFH